MEFIKKLIDVANKLDSKGLYKEASKLDKIINNIFNKLAAPSDFGILQPSYEDSAPQYDEQGIGEIHYPKNWPYNVEPKNKDDFEIVNNPALAAGRRKLHALLGLNYNPRSGDTPQNPLFTKEMSIMLNKLNKYLPGTFVGSKQPISQIIKNTELAMAIRNLYQRGVDKNTIANIMKNRNTALATMNKILSEMSSGLAGTGIDKKPNLEKERDSKRESSPTPSTIKPFSTPGGAPKDMKIYPEKSPEEKINPPKNRYFE